MTLLSPLLAAKRAAESARVLAESQWEGIVDSSDAVEMTEAINSARTALDAALVRVAPLLEDSPALHDAGWASAKDFLTHLLGGYKGAGSGLLRTAEHLRDLPMVQSALDEGLVSLPQARVIGAKVATLPRLEEFRVAVAERMMELAIGDGLDASDLGKAFDDVVTDLDPDAVVINMEKARVRAERGAHQARYLSFSEDQHGGVRVKGYGTVEDAEAIRAALLPLSAPVTTEPGACGGRQRRSGESSFDDNGIPTQIPCPNPGCAHDGRDYRDHGARLWDALVEACDRLKATETLPRDHGSVARVVVTIDHESLRQESISAGLAQPGETSTGGRLSASALRRIACDAEVIPAVLGTEAQPLDVGRTRRLVTPAIWNALLIRDKHCTFPGCSRLPLACDAHHIQHWADGGATSVDNMIMLCRRHHTVIHNSPWTVRIDPDTQQPVWIPPPRQTLDEIKRRVTYAPSRTGELGKQPRAA